MFKIGEFSSLSKTTVKALRFYEEKGLLSPEYTDKFTGYRYYAAGQLITLQKIIAYRQAGLKIADIKLILSGSDELTVLEKGRDSVINELDETSRRLTRISGLIKSLKENKLMDYQATVKNLSECTVYYRQGKIATFSKIPEFIMSAEREIKTANSKMTVAAPNYCFISYLDGEFKSTDISVEYAEAVTEAGTETENVKFKKLDAVEAVCVYHKGSYDGLGKAYACAFNYAEDNNYKVTGAPRERYIEGLWSKKREEEWLTEIQIPVCKK